MGTDPGHCVTADKSQKSPTTKHRLVQKGDVPRLRTVELYPDTWPPVRPLPRLFLNTWDQAFFMRDGHQEQATPLQTAHLPGGVLRTFKGSS